MKKCLAAGLLVVLFASISVLGQSAAADDPATREDVTKLFDVMNSREQIHAVMDAMLKQQRAMLRTIIKKEYPDTSDEQLQRYDSVMDNFVKSFPIDSLLDDMAPVYQKHLSKADVEAMVAFYSAPTGQKLLREMPGMMTDSMQAMAPRLQMMIEKMKQRVEQVAKDEHEKKAGSTPKPTS